ncbi:MAG: hypothetical protein G3I09_05920 [Ferrovum sp.]|nr:hypothetical protein [Ferrovum sp.]
MRPYFGLILSFALGCFTTSAPAEESSKGSGNSQPSLVDRAEHTVDHGLKAGAHGVDRGVHAAARGVERGAKAAEKGVQRGAEATARVVDRVTEKLGGAPASAPPKNPP